MAEPRKITIKLRPVGAKPAAKPAGAPAAEATPAAPAPEPPKAEPTPVAPVAEAPVPEAAPAPAAPVATAAPTPVPVAEAPKAPEPAAAPEPTPAPKAEAPAPAPAPVAEAGSEAAQQAKRQTSRIELPPEITQQPMNAAPAEEKTIKLKPVSASATPAKDETQAAKSKTARIALDSVLGGIQSNTPLANTTQKTIKLKRATPPGGAAKPKASAPMTPVSGGEGGEEKTIKLKRPGTITLKKAPGPGAPATTPKPADEPELEQLESLDDAELTPLADLPPLPEAKESTGSKVFTIIAIVAACVALILTALTCLKLQQQAASPNGEEATGNTLHSLPFKAL